MIIWLQAVSILIVELLLFLVLFCTVARSCHFPRAKFLCEVMVNLWLFRVSGHQWGYKFDPRSFDSQSIHPKHAINLDKALVAASLSALEYVWHQLYELRPSFLTDMYFDSASASEPVYKKSARTTSFCLDLCMAFASCLCFLSQVLNMMQCI